MTSSEFSINSIEKLGISSGGLPQTTSEGSWSLSPWTDPNRLDEISVVFEGTVTSADQRFSFAQRAHGIDALNRVISCYIVAALPSAKVWDALDVLTEMYETHQARLTAIPAVSSVRVVQGHVVSKETRPGTLLSE